MVKIDTGFKFSLDISIKAPGDLTYVENTVKHAATWFDHIKVVDRSRRSFGAQGSQDPLQAWDITFECATIKDACDEIWKYKQSLESLSPLVGYMQMFNFDFTKSNIVVEASNSQVFRDLMVELLDWVLMVSPGMAVICTRTRTVNLKALDEFVEACIKYNNTKHGAKVSTGVAYVERIVLSKALMEDPEVALYLKSPNNRVYYDRYVANLKTGTARMNVNQTKNTMANDETEVVATLGNWTMVSDKDDMVTKLQFNIVPYLLRELEKIHGYIRPKSFSDDQLLKFSYTHLPWVFKIKCADSILAAKLCLLVVDLKVNLQDSLGNINFSSQMHRLAKQDLDMYFKNLSIKDADDEYKHEEEYHVVQDPEFDHVDAQAGSSKDG